MKKHNKILGVLAAAALMLSGCGGMKPGQQAVVGTLTQTEARDTVPPQITGVEDMVVYENDTVDFSKGILATDDTDLSPELTVDSSGVDLGVPGTYAVWYRARDLSGNTATQGAVVTVLEKLPGYQSMENINNAVDAALDRIITGDMTVLEQVKAVYTWARSNISYGGHTDQTDRYQAAYTTLTQLRGDCYGYFSLTKLMFERLGIPNLDVRKVKNFDGDSNHFWSMVSVDGEETWYHFDATPRVGNGDNFCLVTDEFLDDYSQAHKNSHNRDKSLYPATPAEPVA